MTAEERSLNKINLLFVSFYLEAGDFSADGLAKFGHGVRVLADGDHVVVSDGREALVVQQLLSNLGQAGLKLQVLAHICVGSHQDYWGKRSHGLKQRQEHGFFKRWKKNLNTIYTIHKSAVNYKTSFS